MIESFKIIRYESLGSTQEEAKYLLKEQKAGHGYAIATDMQIKGKGRSDRKWVGEKGDLACTFILKPEKNVDTFPQISFVSAITVGDVIKKYIQDSKISYKWPNDLMIEDKKLSGILLELLKNKYLLVGIGINIVNTLERNIANIYNLKQSNSKINFESILLELSKRFAYRYNQWHQMGFLGIKNLWIQAAKNLGKEITVNYSGKEIVGRFLDIDDNGNMILQKKGKKMLIKIGEVFFDQS